MDPKTTPKEALDPPAESNSVQQAAEDNNDGTPAASRGKEGCCCVCGSKFMAVVAHDAIYGSFVGPHPVSFLCLCTPCKGCCRKGCVRAVSVASVSTKVMYFIMLFIVSMLACFFIVPWPQTWLSYDTSIADFYSCRGKQFRNQHMNGGCVDHGGYFMVYRCFLAFCTVMITNSLIMINVKSTKSNPHRAKIHRGFWFYKYLYLTGLLFLYFLCMNGSMDREGVFEFTISLIGNLVNILFTLIELTFILDVVELWVVENETGRSRTKWFANLVYWLVTMIISLLALTVLGYVFKDFSMEQGFGPGENENCVEGKRIRVDYEHLIIILVSIGTVLLLMFIMCIRRDRKRYPYTGSMQVSVVALFNFLFLWSGLYSSPSWRSRPHCNWAERTHTREELQPGSKDIYFKCSGFFHGVLAVLALLYYTFVHGPRSETAPLSVAFYILVQDNARIPVFPDEDDSPKQYLEAMGNFHVWDDEQDEVAFSWSMFYLMMTLGGFSLMMAMTNFIDPWAQDKYNSSAIARACKVGAAILGTFIYAGFLACANSQNNPDSPESGSPVKMRGRKIKKFVSDAEKMEADGGGEDITENIGTNGGVENADEVLTEVVSSPPSKGASSPMSASPPKSVPSKKSIVSKQSTV